MPEDRCDECGVLSALKDNHDVLKLTESCCTEGGHSRCDPCSKFVTLQAQVQEVEKTLLNLKAAQQSLISTINSHHSSFIRNVPNEVVGLIFSFCHDPAPVLPGRNMVFPSQRFCMLTLGAVCKRWREIAWATPELWTLLRMPDIPDSADSSFSVQAELAKEWLGRSANLPLHISLETQVCSRNPKFNPHVGKLIESINSYSRRWQCLEIWIPKMYLPLFQNIPSETAPNEPERLQHLRLDGFRLASKTRVAFNADGDFLKPTKVTLGPLSVRLLRIDWGNVTSLNCSSLFMDEFLELIRLAPKVTDFAVGIREGHDNHLIPLAPLIHSQLRKLTIKHGHDISPDVLFSNLTSPLLESLSYEMTGEWTMQAHILIGFFVRSHAPLRHLSLARALMRSQDLEELLMGLPLLEDLEILFDNKAACLNFLLIRLARGLPPRHTDSSPFLPQLRSLKYQYYGSQTLRLDYIPSIFGKDVNFSDRPAGNEALNDNRVRPMQSLTIAIDSVYRLFTGEKLQCPKLRKATVKSFLNLIKNEGKTIEISYSGVDVVREYESGNIEYADTA